MSLIADRYASSQMRQIWSRESKVLKERELWITVMKAQAKLGLEISKDVVEDYELYDGSKKNLFVEGDNTLIPIIEIKQLILLKKFLIAGNIV